MHIFIFLCWCSTQHVYKNIHQISLDTCPLPMLCVQAEMEMESLVLARNQLLQQWSGSLVGMRRRDEAFSAMQDAVR